MRQTFRRQTVRIAVVLALSSGVLVSRGLQAQASRAAEAQFKAAQQTEEVQGDLKGAIEQYKKLAEGSDKAIAAKALLQMAGCYEKLGQSDAQKAYERVVREFADQAESAATARTRLAAMGTRSSTRPTDASYHILWTTPGHGTFVSSVSPDGRYISSENTDEGDDLFLHDLVTGLDRQLTKGGTKGGPQGRETAWGESAFSRDSKQLAYGWNNNQGLNELRVIDLQGSGIPQARHLVINKGGFEPFDWTPDGQWIAALAFPEDKADKSTQIVLISTIDGSLRRLKDLGQRVRAEAMRFSPDGKYLAFDLRPPEGNRDIFLIALAGGLETPVVVNRATDRLLGWSADGTQLIFTSDRTGSNGLFALRVGDGKPRGEPELVRSDIGPLEPLALTTSGALYYRGAKAGTGARGFDVKIGSFDFMTGEILSTGKDLFFQYFAASNRSPDWSADGTSLAYVVEQSPRAGDFSLAIRSLETDQAQLLRPALGHVDWLRWAPDGESFVVAGSDLKGVSGLWRVDRTTAEVAAIAPGTFSTRTSDWPQIDDRFHGSSADARKVYYQRSIGGHQTPNQGVVLFERDLASGVERELFRRPAPGPGVAGYPGFAVSLSADGKKLYYRQGLGVQSASDPSALQAAFIERDLASGVEKELTRGNLGFLYLSPDGRSIATNTADLATKSQSILLVPVAGGQPRTLMQIALPQSVIDSVMLSKDPHGQNAISVLWAPDSRSLVFRHNFVRGTPDLWWVSVDGREAPKLVNLGVPERLWDVRVHPDGRRITIASPRQQPSRPDEIWVLENVLPKAGPKR